MLNTTGRQQKILSTFYLVDSVRLTADLFFSHHPSQYHSKDKMEGEQRRVERDDEGIVKIELKQLPLYVAYVIVFLQFANPTLVTDLVNTYFTNMVYIILIVGGFAYIQGLQYFRDLFNIHKNDTPQEHQ